MLRSCAFLVVLLASSAAQAQDSSEGESPRDFPPVLLRFHGGLGALLSGGSVRAPGEPPDLGSQPRVLADILAFEAGVRPFLGGLVVAIGARLAASTDTEVVTTTANLLLEYDLVSPFDGDPERPVAVALGGSLGLTLAYSRFHGADPPRDPQYWLLHPEWRIHLEGRFRTQPQQFFLVRAEIATGFDDITHVLRATLNVGYALGLGG